MKHLSGIDATFLYLETPEMPMHVGSLNVFDLPAGYTGDWYEDVKKHIASRMHLAPLFQRKLALMPFELANPVWVDDDDVDLDYHIRRIVLPKPGSMEQLEQYVGRLHSSLLDRSRPLWEFYVIDGLQSGQVAFYSKIHHSAMDGAAGVAVAQSMFDLTPEPRSVKPPRQRHRINQYQLGMAELAGAAISNTVSQYVKLAKLLPTIARTVIGVVLSNKGAKGQGIKGLLKNLSFGPKTPINVAVTNQRSFAGISIPLAEVKQVTKRMEVTVNDVVMAICAGALRRYLAEEGCKPEKPLRAAVPVSLREAGNTDMTNQVSMMMVSLATDIKDPADRLMAIRAAANSAKDLSGKVKNAIPMDFPSFGVPWIMTGLVSLYGRTKLANTLPPIANVTISNVPGPQVPLYLAGARMATYYPVSIPVHGLALNITIQSYNGMLGFGLTACRRALPDVRTLANYLGDAHNELLHKVQALPPLAAPEPPAVPEAPAAHAPRPRRKPAAKTLKSVKVVEISATPRTRKKAA